MIVSPCLWFDFITNYILQYYNYNNMKKNGRLIFQSTILFTMYSELNRPSAPMYFNLNLIN